MTYTLERKNLKIQIMLTFAMKEPIWMQLKLEVNKFIYNNFQESCLCSIKFLSPLYLQIGNNVGFFGAFLT